MLHLSTQHKLCIFQRAYCIAASPVPPAVPGCCYANENHHLLQDILHGEWGYDGAVVTDWGGSNDHVEGVREGSTLEMPCPGFGSAKRLMQAVEEGRLPESAVDARVDELLELVFTTDAAVKAAPKRFDRDAHHALAQMTGGMVGQETVDGIVMEAKGFWIIGLLRALIGFGQNAVSNRKFRAALDAERGGPAV